MRTSALARCCAVLMPLLLMACAAANSIHYSFPGVKGSRVITVDAKQRHLIMTRRGKDDIRACAEAAPDVFSALSSSFGGSLNVGAASRQGEVATALAESAATIERTQTINLLRESFFSTCQLWLSGAIKQDEFATRAARDHRSMVAVLAIEQMTGVVKPASTVISGPAVSAAVGQSEELVKLLQGYRDERIAARSALTAAEKAYTDANTLHPADGSADAKRICTLDPAPTGAEAAHKACKDAEVKHATAKTAADAAEKRESAVLGQLAALSAGLSAATTAGQSNFGGLDYDKQKISDTKMALIAQSVEKIALTAGVDEALMFCTTYLNTRQFDPADTTRAACNAVVVVRAEQDSKVAAEITGADAASISEVLTLANDPQGQAAAREREARYRVFRIGLGEVLARTNEAQWNERWQAFATATNVSSVECGSLSQCREFVARSGTSPFRGAYGRNPESFDEALAAWQAALTGANAARTDQGETP